MHFGPDGKLYIAVGENANSANSQTLANLLGKILRINADGTIPTDNPFFSTGHRPEPRDLGARPAQPLHVRVPARHAAACSSTTSARTPGRRSTTASRAPTTAGPTPRARPRTPSHRGPLFSYGHGSSATTGCAITGGAFYNPATEQFPPIRTSASYFFADFCSRLDPPVRSRRAAPRPGSRRGDPQPGRPAGRAGRQPLLPRARQRARSGRSSPPPTRRPQITSHPAEPDRLRGPARHVQRVRVGHGAPAPTSGSATAATSPAPRPRRYTLAPRRRWPTTAPSSRPSCRTPSGSATSNGATLHVTSNNPPVATITSPANSTLYSAGDTIGYAGTGSDPEDGALPPSAFTWQVDFHHDTHAHPFLPRHQRQHRRLVHDPRHRGDRDQRLVPDPPDRARFGRAHPHDVRRRRAAHRRPSAWPPTRPASSSRSTDSPSPLRPRSGASSACGARSASSRRSPAAARLHVPVVVRRRSGDAHDRDPGQRTRPTPPRSRPAPSPWAWGCRATYFNNHELHGHRRSRGSTPRWTSTGARACPSPASPPTPSACAGRARCARRSRGRTRSTRRATTACACSSTTCRSSTTGPTTPRTENSGTIALTAGQLYDIRMEFYENGGNAVARLSWSAPGVAKEVDPAREPVSVRAVRGRLDHAVRGGRGRPRPPRGRRLRARAAHGSGGHDRRRRRQGAWS